MDEEKRIKWNDENRERRRMKNKYKKIKENMKGAGGGGGVCVESTWTLELTGGP